jgi:sialidase-1
VPLRDGRIVAVAWVHDPRTQEDQPNHFALSTDGGQTFGAPRSTGLHGQTCKVVQLEDGRLLCVYRRSDQPGLWANLASLDDGQWSNLGQIPVWQGVDTGRSAATSSADLLAALRFGYPSPARLENGEVLVAFWCVEACLSVIRLARLRVGV